MSADETLSGKTIEAARRAVAARFKLAGIETPELDARLLIGAVLNLDHTGLAVETGRRITGKEAAAIENFVLRRIAHEPVARVLGYKEFWGLNFKLSDETLIPRPDTETVVAAALEFLRKRPASLRPVRIADIGTGSGAILLALLSEIPNATGVGTDISADALAAAHTNAQNFGLAARTNFVCCDYAETLSGPFDVIVSNPPYIPSADVTGLAPEVRDHDPHLALDGGADGLEAYRRIAVQAAALLTQDGALIVEVGYDQGAEVSQIMRAAGLTVQGPPRADLGGIDRVVTALKSGF